MADAYVRTRRHKKAKRTAGDLTLNSTTWTNVDTALDMALGADVGDVIEYGVNFAISGHATNYAYFDVVTAVSGAPVNSFASEGAAPTATTSNSGLMGWFITATPDTIPVSGAVRYTVTAGDLDAAGAVTLRFRYATLNTSGRTLYASASFPLKVYASNIGPEDST